LLHTWNQTKSGSVTISLCHWCWRCSPSRRLSTKALRTILLDKSCGQQTVLIRRLLTRTNQWRPKLYMCYSHNSTRFWNSYEQEINTTSAYKKKGAVSEKLKFHSAATQLKKMQGYISENLRNKADDLHTPRTHRTS
jgi:hypothetical protein